MHPDRWFGVGSAEGLAPGAGSLAAAEAILHADPKLLVVFCSSSHDLPALLEEIRGRSGEAALVGCSTAGEITTAGPRTDSVVIAAFGGEGFAVDTAVATDASRDLRAAGALASRCLPERDDLPHKVLLVLTDGLAGDQQEVLRGAHSVLGAAVPLVGGCAGDDLQMTRTHQLYDDQVLTDSVVAAGIASTAPFGIGVRHGWRRVGEPMLVTSSGGNRVHTLDDRPALDVYLEHLGVTEHDNWSQERLAEFALTHPLGLGRPNDEDLARFISGADLCEGSLSCIAEIPQGALVWIMAGDARSVLEAAAAAGRDSLIALDGAAPLGLVAFDCIARRDVLKDEDRRAEIDRLTSSAPGVPVAGFYTYGEIARTRGVRGFHNQTLVVLSVG